MIERLNAALEGRYRIEREIGAGGMATVYLAEDQKHGRKVAVKVLRPELAAVVGAERFLAEIETTANLQHPHILPLFDSGEADGFLFYVMPYVEGDSLRDRLEKEHQLPVDEALEIAANVGSALQYAHEQGVVHRDVKPANILLSRDQPLVADFGIALALSEAGDGRITETGLSLGTPHYMSPEQASGDRTLDKRSDVYALGSVLYEMLTGSPPYPGPTAQAVLGSILTAEPKPPTEHRKAIPPNVSDAILRSLEKLPADRFGSAAAFVAALKDPTFRWGGEGGGAAGAAGAGRWKVTAAVAAGLAAALAVALVALILSAPDPPATERQRIVLTPFSGVPPNWLATGAALEPGGDGIVFSDTAGSGSGIWAFWFKPGGQADPVLLPNTVEADRPVFSPDGEWLAFFTAENELRKQPLRGGTSVLLADSAGAGTLAALAWLEDGTILFESAESQLRRVGEDGGEIEIIAERDDLGGTPSHLDPLRGHSGALMITCPTGSCGPGTGVLWLVALERDTLAVLREDVVRAWHTADDQVVYVDTRGAVFAAPLDREALTLGTPTPLFDGVRASVITAEILLDVDGTLLYRQGSGSGTRVNEQVVWVDRTGQPTPVDADWLGDFETLALSPDESRLAITDETADQAIWVKELPDGPLTRLTPDAGHIRPDWMPDGRHVVYRAGDPASSLVYEIRRADASTEPRPFLRLDEAVIQQVDVSRDGRYVVYRVNSSPDGDLRYAEIRDGDTTHHDLIIRPGTNELVPALSPDDRWLAYVSDVSGTPEVYVRPFPDVMSARVKVSDGGGYEPGWSHDGSELFYMDGDGMFVAAAVETEPAFRIAAREPLFQKGGPFSTSIPTERRYDVTRDGRFVMIALGANQGSEPEISELILVDDWFTELRSILDRR